MLLKYVEMGMNDLNQSSIFPVALSMVLHQFQSRYLPSLA